jgi:hypothetical protein
MAYTIKGTYELACNCKLLCPCNVDGVPTGEGDQCHGVSVYTVREGHLDDTDLSGVSFALTYYVPSNPSAGNWKIGAVVDDGASEDQAQALDRILSGQEGGPFAEFGPLIGEYVGIERASVSGSHGDAPSGSIVGVGDFTIELARGPDGGPTTVSNALFGFAPVYTVGKGSGRLNVFGSSHDVRYAESAEYEYSSETG